MCPFVHVKEAKDGTVHNDIIYKPFFSSMQNPSNKLLVCFKIIKLIAVRWTSYQSLHFKSYIRHIEIH